MNASLTSTAAEARARAGREAEQDTHRAALWALLFGNFVIGAGVLAPAGLINELRQAFNIDAPTVGTLIGYGAIVLCFGAPLLAYFTNRIDRRTLLTSSLVLFTAGHFASALAPNFATLLAIRVVMVMSAAVFTPQAASAVTLLVPPEKRASAVTASTSRILPLENTPFHDSNDSAGVRRPRGKVRPTPIAQTAHAMPIAM